MVFFVVWLHFNLHQALRKESFGEEMQNVNGPWFIIWHKCCRIIYHLKTTLSCDLSFNNAAYNFNLQQALRKGGSGEETQSLNGPWLLYHSSYNLSFIKQRSHMIYHLTTPLHLGNKAQGNGDEVQNFNCPWFVFIYH